MSKLRQKIALLSDIHGNVTAFDEVIADTIQESVTDYWILGDVIMQGSGGSEILARLNKLKPSVWVKGNWDDLFLYVQQRKDLDIMDPTDVYTTRLGMTLLTEMSAKDIQQLEALPLCQTKKISGLTIQISHNLPDKHFGSDLIANAPLVNIDRLFPTDEIDIALYGHIHHQLMRHGSQEQLIINPGSIGFPFSARKKLQQSSRAHYAILTIDESGSLDVAFKQIPYNIEHELLRAKEKEMPYQDLYQEALTFGTNKTHDKKLLAQINQERGYLKEVRRFLTN